MHVYVHTHIFICHICFLKLYTCIYRYIDRHICIYKFKKLKVSNIFIENNIKITKFIAIFASLIEI